MNDDVTLAEMVECLKLAGFSLDHSSMSSSYVPGHGYVAVIRHGYSHREGRPALSADGIVNHRLHYVTLLELSPDYGNYEDLRREVEWFLRDSNERAVFQHAQIPLDRELLSVMRHCS